jgi:hypothetical protein
MILSHHVACPVHELFWVGRSLDHYAMPHPKAVKVSSQARNPTTSGDLPGARHGEGGGVCVLGSEWRGERTEAVLRQAHHSGGGASAGSTLSRARAAEFGMTSPTLKMASHSGANSTQRWACRATATTSTAADSACVTLRSAALLRIRGGEAAQRWCGR